MSGMTDDVTAVEEFAERCRRNKLLLHGSLRLDLPVLRPGLLAGTASDVDGRPIHTEGERLYATPFLVVALFSALIRRRADDASSTCTHLLPDGSALITFGASDQVKAAAFEPEGMGMLYAVPSGSFVEVPRKPGEFVSGVAVAPVQTLKVTVDDLGAAWIRNLPPRVPAHRLFAAGAHCGGPGSIRFDPTTFDACHPPPPRPFPHRCRNLAHSLT